MLLVLVIVHASPAEAQAQTALLEQDIWRQISPSITGSNSGAQQTDGLTLTAGQTYYLYVGTNAAFGKTVSVGTSGNDLFLLNEQGVLTPGPKGADAVLLQMTNTTSTYNPYYAVVRVTPTTTAPYYLATNSGGFGSPGSLSTGWVFPPGDTAGHPGVVGYHGAWDPSGSSTSEIAFAIKCCPQVQSESGIRQSQTSTLPAGSKFTWSRINSPVAIVDLPSVGTGGNVAEIAQSFQAPVGGAYLETTRIGMFGSGNYNCGGTLRVSITNTLSVPWNNAGEAAAVQASWTLSGTAPTSSFVTINWVAATLTDDAGSVSFGTPTWSISGNTVTGENLKFLAPPVSPSQGTYWLRAYWDNSGCLPNAYVMSRYSGGNSFSGGSAWTVSGGVWTEQAAQDFGGILLGAYGGNKTYEWKLNATPNNFGGATYVYLAEHQRDSNLALAEPTTSWGGAAISDQFFELAGGAGSPECAFASITNSACNIREYRLGYMTQPYNSTAGLVVSMNMNGMGRNLVYVGTLVNQPTQTHVAKLSWDYQEGTGNDLVVYELFSSDDYFAKVTFTVKECVDSPCSALGNVTPSVAYTVRVCPTGRIEAGNADAAGRFNASGQDLPGCELAITLTGSGYAQTTWSVTIPSGGNYVFTIGIFQATTQAGAPLLGATSITLVGNTTRTIPDRLEINITRGRNVDLFVGLDKIDTTTGLQQHNVIRAIHWAQSDPNTLGFYYPNRARSASADAGLYILWVMNETGIVLKHEKLFIIPQGGSTSTYDVVVTADMIRAIQQEGYVSAQQTFQSEFQASLLLTQKSIRDQVYEDFQKISDYGWFVLGFLLFLATVRAFRR